jgi:TolB protein
MNKPNHAVWITAALCILCLTSAPSAAQASQAPLGIFEGQNDVGTVLHPGTVAYDPSQKTYTLTGSGENMWLTKDAFHFLWKKASGDISLTADIRFPTPGANPHRKAVLLLRQTLDGEAVYADATVHGVGLTALQYRPESGAVTGDIELNGDAPRRLRIEKRGDYVTMLLSYNGEPLRPAGTSMRVPLNGTYYIGLGVCSHDKDVIETAVFSNVEIKPIMNSGTHKPVLHSTLQTISIDGDARRANAVFTTQGYFEAPNWTRDGKSLIFDQGGRIMTVPIEGGTPKPISTDDAKNCNGSHGLSPDGKFLAISCSLTDSHDSRVYIMPSTGGTPRVVTENPFSYFHSWSPDGRTIAFARPHPGGGDFWSISVDGGKETRLTTTNTVSDDPDYSADGQYIYFNSDRGGGSMQIWRIKADGSQSEQITSDERNNWTPHPSPDGKWIVYLSYDKTVTGHPANKDVSLRLMFLADGKTHTLVDVFGGSGTINVPSWSPDSHHLAFVSYELVNPD